MEDIKTLRNIQINLQKFISLERIDTSKIKTIAGVDTSYVSVNDKEYGICCIEVFDYETMKHIGHFSENSLVTNPYIPGYFAFRELPVILKTLPKLPITPDLFMIDGNGYLHENNMGIATMFSIDTKIPSIGVSKNYYHIDGASYEELENVVGDSSKIMIDGKCYGYAVRTRKDCKPVFVSPGNLISFDDSLEVVRHCIDKQSRVPIPTRIADIATHEEKKKFILEKHI